MIKHRQTLDSLLKRPKTQKESKPGRMPILADYFMSVTVPPTGRVLFRRFICRGKHRTEEPTRRDCGQISCGGS